MGKALTSLRAATESVCALLADAQDMEAVAEYTPTLTLLNELKKRVCHTVPSQGTKPTADEVVAAIRADPDIASAAAAALATMTF
jgi:hypothetical protein